MSVDSPAGWALEHARRRPDAPAVDGVGGVRLSYAALARAVGALGAELRAAGFGPGQRLLVALPSAPCAAVAILAAQAAGGCAVPLDRGLGGAALRNVLAQTGARCAVVWGPDLASWTEPGLERLERLWAVRPDGREEGGPDAAGARVAWLGPEGAPGRPPAAGCEPWPVSVSDEALVLFTSGSTGEPRGVRQTYGNIAANTRSIVRYLGLGAADRALAILPLFYCYGLSVLQTHLHAGGSVFLEPRSMYPRLLLDGLAAEGCTGLAGVPLTFELLRRKCDVAAAPKPRLRYVTQAGGAMARETIAWARRSFGPAPLYVMYGQTEATARLAYLPPERAEEKAGSIGVAIPGVELRVVGPDGRELPAGEVGELVARGENVAAGYLSAPEETAATFRADGLHTGDLARRDEDGFFFITGRAKEMLKIGGHRESPARIEQAALQHPDVLEAAVAGVPDPVLGEAPAMLVVRRPGGGAGERELRAFCRARLPAHCVPVTVRFVSALPRSNAGKIQRAELVRLALAGEGP